MSKLDKEIQSSLTDIERSKNLLELESIRIKYFGKNGIINSEMRKLSTLSIEEKKEAGKKLNNFKEVFNNKVLQKKVFFESEEINQKIKNEFLDPTLPIRPNLGVNDEGKVHLITQTIEEIVSILGKMGLSFQEGPDIEDDFHNFTALNIPKDHPARQMHDTFYIQNSGKTENVLRTHTSPVQIRSLKKGEIPLKIFAPGRTYRCDSDMTHTPMFHQVEGLVVDKNINFANLKWFISNFCKIFFKNEELKLRFRPSFFPFTEPSAEVDINCTHEKGKVILGKGTDWMEIMGCGMVHPNVFKACGFHDNITGFAFGMGIERLAMLKYGASDLRDFFDNDIRWLKHFGFSYLNLPDLNWD